MTDKQAFRIEVTSPWGRKPLEKFEHWMRKVSDGPAERWGIEIEIERIEREE
jgi:hypothetical protein